MKTFSLGIILASMLTAAGEADVWKPPVKLFSLPQPKLQKLPETPLKTLPILDLSLIPPVNAELSAPSVLDASEQYKWINGHDLLTHIEPIEPAGAYGWLSENLFALDVVPYKKVKLTGSLVTAIHRKNPFFLIHPFIFGIDW